MFASNRFPDTWLDSLYRLDHAEAALSDSQLKDIRLKGARLYPLGPSCALFARVASRSRIELGLFAYPDYYLPGLLDQVERGEHPLSAIVQELFKRRPQLFLPFYHPPLLEPATTAPRGLGGGPANHVELHGSTLVLRASLSLKSFSSRSLFDSAARSVALVLEEMARDVPSSRVDLSADLDASMASLVRVFSAPYPEHVIEDSIRKTRINVSVTAQMDWWVVARAVHELVRTNASSHHPKTWRALAEVTRAPEAYEYWSWVAHVGPRSRGLDADVAQDLVVALMYMTPPWSASSSALCLYARDCNVNVLMGLIWSKFDLVGDAPAGFDYVVGALARAIAHPQDDGEFGRTSRLVGALLLGADIPDLHAVEPRHQLVLLEAMLLGGVAGAPALSGYHPEALRILARAVQLSPSAYSFALECVVSSGPHIEGAWRIVKEAPRYGMKGWSTDQFELLLQAFTRVVLEERGEVARWRGEAEEIMIWFLEALGDERVAQVAGVAACVVTPTLVATCAALEEQNSSILRRAKGYAAVREAMVAALGDGGVRGGLSLAVQDARAGALTSVE